MRTRERIPIHDHADRDSGGLIASSVIVRIVGGAEGGASSSGPASASDVAVADIGGHYAGDTVEAVLAELGAAGGHWEPVTNGDVDAPDLVFEDGDVVMQQVT